MNINKKLLISEERIAPGSALDLYGMELAKYIAEEFESYGIYAGLDGGDYEASEVYRGNSDMERGRHIEVNFDFFIVFGKDSGITAGDEKVFKNFLEEDQVCGRGLVGTKPDKRSKDL